METAEYWLMAHEYAIWNAAIASLQILGRRPQPNFPRHSLRMHLHHLLLGHLPAHTLCQLSEDVLYWMFVIALNGSIYPAVSLADEGYKSGSDTADLPTPLQKPLHTPHV